MKKLLIFSSIPLLLTTVYLSYKLNELNKEIAVFEGKITPPLSVTDCFSCGDTLGRKPFNYLEVATLTEMAFSYQRQMSTHGLGNQIQDAKSIWFSLDALKAFIWEIQKDTCGKKDCDGNTLSLGIRIYYARYPKFNTLNNAGKLLYPDLQDVDKNYINLHTVFMVPTFDSSGYQKDFDPRYYDVNNQCPKTITTDGWPVSQRVLALTPTNSTSQNHGGLCPPLTNCKGASFIK